MLRSLPVYIKKKKKKYSMNPVMIFFFQEKISLIMKNFSFSVM